MTAITALASLHTAMPTRPDTDPRKTPPAQRLRNAQVDAASGMHIGTVAIGEQTLRVGIRPGAAASRPLLVFNGIGANLELVAPFLSELAGVEAVIFDLPGAGHSPAPKLPYRLFTMARLAGQLLDHLGYEQVDVMGVSWGGALAQQFAIQTPRRVRRLILAATSMGGTMLPSHPRVLLKMVSPRRYADKGYMSRIAPDIYGGDLRTSPVAIKLFTDHARGGDQRGYAFQMLAVLGWSSLPWLWRIRQPTLLLAGRDDPLVPLVNARLHAWLLRNSRLHVMDDGHLFLFTRARESAQVIGAFLREQTNET